jgi:O-antigen/teichoic acid export membrane protein
MASDHSTTGRLAVRNTVWLTLFSYAGQFLAFVATIILTRQLGPRVFGLLSIGVFWVSLLALRSKSGISYAALRQPAVTGELLGSFYRLDLLFSTGSLVLGLGAAIILPYLGYEQQISSVIVVLMICEFLPALVGPVGLALEKELQLSRMTLISLISTAVSYGLGIVLALLGMGLGSLLVMNLLNTCLGLIGVYWVGRRRLPQIFQMKWNFKRDTAKLLLKQGVPLGLANQGQQTIVNQYDNFLIGTYVGPTILGYYDRAYRLSQWPNVLLTQVLARVGLLTFAKVQDDIPRLTHAMRLSLWVVTTLGLPIALILTFGASEIVEILYGPGWAASSFFLRFLAVYTLFSPIISLGGTLAYAVGNVRVAVLITVAQVLTILSVATMLTFVFGAIGTVLGVGVTVAVGFVISALYIFRRLPLGIRATFGAPALAAGIASVITLFVMSQPGWPEKSNLVRLIIIGFTSAGLYLICLVAFKPAEMLERIRYLTRTFRGVKSTQS